MQRKPMSERHDKCHFDPAARAAKKQAMRKSDMAAIRSGVPAKEVAIANSAFSVVDFSRARIIRYPE